MGVNKVLIATAIAVGVMAGSASAGAAWAASDPAVAAYDASLRPIHWWIGNLENRAEAATADLVASWSYWPLDGVLDVTKEQRRMRLLVGGATSIDAANQAIRDRYAQGFRMLATNHENWTTRTSVAHAQSFVNTIDSRPGLTVLQWNHWLTWADGARAVLENAAQLELVEMAYPTAEGKRIYADIHSWIMESMQRYSAGREPGIGLSVYTAHDSATPIGWELMKTQIDAAKAVGEALGSPRHPIGIYISNAEPTEFTVDDVNNYIIYGTRSPALSTVLDPFENGDLVLEASTSHGALVHDQALLPSRYFPAGRRITDLHLESGNGMRATLETDAPDRADDALTITLEPGSKGNVTMSYMGGSPADLAVDGGAAFEVTLASAPPSGTLFAYARGADSWDYAELPIHGPGTYAFAFADLHERSQELDFTRVGSLGFGLQGRATSTALTYRVSDFRVAPRDAAPVTRLPEPTILALFGPGGALLLLAGARSR